MEERDGPAPWVSSSHDVSAHNRVRVLESVMRSGPSSRVALARTLGMSPATVNRLTSALMRLGFIEHAGNATTGGRPSMLVRFQPHRKTVLALDIWEAAIEVAVLDLSGSTLERDRVPMNGATPDGRLELLVDTVSLWDTKLQGSLAAVGISVPGPVSTDGIVLLAPALEWYDVDALSPIRDVTSVPVVIENDVNLIALAEYRHLNSPNHKTLVAVAVFQGVGAGIVEDGRMWRGNHGAAGQFGRMLQDVSGLRHRKHGFGQLETELGSKGILDRAIEARVVSPEVGSADTVFASAQSGDQEALAMVEKVADEYAFHLVNVCAMVAPDIVVFGGLFERWSELLIPMISERLEGNVIHLPELRTAELGDEGKLIGAGRNALEAAGGLAALVTG